MFKAPDIKMFTQSVVRAHKATIYKQGGQLGHVQALPLYSSTQAVPELRFFTT